MVFGYRESRWCSHDWNISATSSRAVFVDKTWSGRRGWFSWLQPSAEMVCAVLNCTLYELSKFCNTHDVNDSPYNTISSFSHYILNIILLGYVERDFARTRGIWGAIGHSVFWRSFSTICAGFLSDYVVLYTNCIFASMINAVSNNSVDHTKIAYRRCILDLLSCSEGCSLGFRRKLEDGLGCGVQWARSYLPFIQSLEVCFLQCSIVRRWKL